MPRLPSIVNTKIRGRPPMPAARLKSYAIGLRCNEALYRRLAEASAQSGLTMTEEVRRRVEYAFAQGVSFTVEMHR